MGAGLGAVTLFTGPLKECLQTGAPAMWGLSAIIVLFSHPGAWSLFWLAGCERRPTAAASPARA
ncbi:MAG: hypothetical protein ACM3RP_14045 [Chitinophagales bacterium]